jgi:hypothetical protein
MFGCKLMEQVWVDSKFNNDRVVSCIFLEIMVLNV